MKIRRILTITALLVLVAALIYVLGRGKISVPSMSELLGLAPNISLDVQQLDFGTIPVGEPVQKTVNVTNTGKGDLVIREVRSACGCTKAEMTQKTIGPGQKAPVTVTVDPHKIAGFDSEKTVYINSNDPGNPTVSFEVLARIEPEFLVDPPTVDFGAHEKGDVMEKTLLVRQLGKERIEVQGIELVGDPLALDVSFEKRPENQWLAPDKPEYNVKVVVLPEVAQGKYTGLFDILTTCARVPRFRCNVKAEISSPYSVAPRRFRAGDILPGNKKVFEIYVSCVKPFDVANLSVTGADFGASLAPREKNRQTIVVESKEGAGLGPKAEFVVFDVTTDGKTYKEKVKFTAKVAIAVPASKKEAK